ncbi:beta-lactamase/transpeptidase-like protein [Polychaeton citri CBS 116435]|uniref:Beta-lactamase/transpeptidase-like protein n=1 Tax=Polychaeton citri CBS 116435 TaxID=1314669 RepID=A0A9P4UKI9_9PEZI|nr:beta-lactamase/transpeptidase-like protein [Polychaeton citri CBS 116435]
MSMACLILAILLIAPPSSAICYEPSPAFPVPQWEHNSPALLASLDTIEKALTPVLNLDEYDSASVSIELTTSSRTIWSRHHSPRVFDEQRPGTKHVDSESVYRVASITKVFTTLGILFQHQARNLSLDDSIDKYVPELDGEMAWHDITLRALASQLSGIPREFAQSDILDEFLDPTKLGLPPSSKQGLPKCNGYSINSRSCEKSDLINRLNTLQPVFAPGWKSSYNNNAFSLLGLAIEAVTGQAFAEYMANVVFEPLGMSSSSFKPPQSDRHVVLPANQSFYFDVDDGVEAPNGGMYSTSADMSRFLRFAMTHYNRLAIGINWFLPVSWAEGSLGSFYGMPWEIFRTDRILNSTNRPVTLVTKTGNLPGYSSKIYILQEYGLGLTILVSGKRKLVDLLEDIVLVNIARAAEQEVWQTISHTHAGDYNDIDPNINTSLQLRASSKSGLELKSFISNGTDAFDTFMPIFAEALLGNNVTWRVQLTPTQLYNNTTSQQGEIWYAVPVPDQSPKPEDPPLVQHCRPTIDPFVYAGQPVMQLIFWPEQRVIDMPAWNVSVGASFRHGTEPMLVIQE